MSDQAGKYVPLAFSHVGIHTNDLEKMVDFYTRVLGFTITDRGVVRGVFNIVFTTWNETEHHQVALIDGMPEEPGFNRINQLSFRVKSIEEIQRIWKRVKDEPDVDGVRGINHGNAWALYFLDPEGNRIEIFTDTDWYIEQPCVEEIDFNESAQAIYERSEAFCKSQPSFKPASEWRQQLGKEIAEKSII